MPIVKFLLSSLIIVLYLEIFFHILKSYHETVLFEFEWKIQSMNHTGYVLNICSHKKGIVYELLKLNASSKSTFL